MSEVIHIHGVHLGRPEIAGRSFSDTAGMSGELCGALIERGMIFVTEFTRNGRDYGGDIVARNWSHAEEIAQARGLGEQVVGALCEVRQA